MLYKLSIITMVLMSLVGCAGLQPTMIDGKEIIPAEKLLFKSSAQDLIIATEEAAKELKWSVGYSGTKETRVRKNPINNSMVGNTRFDEVGINATLRYQRNPAHYMRLSTPIGLTTYGASIFMAFFDDVEGTEVTIAASTSQIVEKEKMPGYIESLINKIKAKVE